MIDDLIDLSKQSIILKESQHKTDFLFYFYRRFLACIRLMMRVYSL